MSAIDALNRVAKWRGLLAGWQLGTRPKGDPECDAVRDHREVTILLRVEGSALTGLLLAKGLITQAEWETALAQEANLLNAAYARRFPGVTATDSGLVLDLKKLTAADSWMRNWKP
jgi:hypothetical protein